MYVKDAHKLSHWNRCRIYSPKWGSKELFTIFYWPIHLHTLTHVHHRFRIRIQWIFSQQNRYYFRCMCVWNESWERQQRRTSMNIQHTYNNNRVEFLFLMYSYSLKTGFVLKCTKKNFNEYTAHTQVCICIAHNGFSISIECRDVNFIYWNVALKMKTFVLYFFYCLFCKSWHTKCLMVMGIVMKLYQNFSELTLSFKMFVISMSLSQQAN